MAIFMIQGALIGIIGTLIGVVGGIAARAQRRHRRAGDRARCSASSSSTRASTTSASCRRDLQRADVVTIAAIALVLALVATIYPSWRAARVNPAEALRYE